MITHTHAQTKKNRIQVICFEEQLGEGPCEKLNWKGLRRRGSERERLGLVISLSPSSSAYASLNSSAAGATHAGLSIKRIMKSPNPSNVLLLGRFKAPLSQRESYQWGMKMAPADKSPRGGRHYENLHHITPLYIYLVVLAARLPHV